MNRAPSHHPAGRVAFVGTGPGDPGLLTVRARDALAAAPLVITDPDVPEAVLALLADGAEVRPAVGTPTDVARELVAEAANGRSVTRLVAGDPLTVDAVVAESLAVSAAGVPFDVVPGVPPSTAVPAYAGVPLGSAHVEADVRQGVDWARLAASPGLIVLHATASHLPEVATSLTMNGLARADPRRRHRERHLHHPAHRAGHAGHPRVRAAPSSPDRSWSPSATRWGCARSCPGGSRGRCTAGACWSRAPRTRRAR